MEEKTLRPDWIVAVCSSCPDIIKVVMNDGHQVLMCPHLTSGEYVHRPMVTSHTEQAAVAVKVDTEDVCWLRAPRINNHNIRNTLMYTVHHCNHRNIELI